MTTITATYSPEDNKIRLYASSRLDAETFQRVKEAGFKWAPKQELFVAPSWSPDREDLALDLAGEIEPEEMTLAERAQAKADRLDALADKRARQATAYARRADDLSQAFYMGQPILVGHHSERKARKMQEKMDAAMRAARNASDAAAFWQYRAEGVAAHANYKNDPRVRARRIKTLLADLRDLQRKLNDAHKALALWARVTDPAVIVNFLGVGATYSFNLRSAVDRGDITPEQARERAMAGATRTIESDSLRRWISHTLHRLGYEREMLGDVPRYAGDISPTLLQIFLREHGADKPKARATDAGGFVVGCDAPLPLHIGDGKALELSSDGWRDLMQACGYVPPRKKPAAPPILNFYAPAGGVDVVNPWRREAETLSQVALTKAEYAAIPSEQRGTRLSVCGGFRVRVAPNPRHTGPAYMAPRAAIVISDQKCHDVPASCAKEPA